MLARNGLNSRERYDVERRIARLEQRIRATSTTATATAATATATATGYDRDRDGRDDRYEDDRGRYAATKPLGRFDPGKA